MNARVPEAKVRASACALTGSLLAFRNCSIDASLNKFAGYLDLIS
jgi:hypothetical protein